MTVKLKHLLFILFLCFFLAGTAQESMLPEVNAIFLQKLIDTAKARYPKMKTFDHRITIANDNFQKAKLSWFDVLSFSMSYSPTNTTTIVAPTLSGYQLSLGFNLGSFIVKPHNIKQAKEEVIIAKLNREEYDLNIEADVKARYYKYVQVLTVLKLQTQMSLDVEAVLKQVKYKFEKGEENFENYTKALLNVSSAKQNIISTEGMVLVAKSTLEEIIGKKLEDIH
jgi:outer membrane protein TolC